MNQNILVVCAGDKSVHRVALKILRFLLTKKQDFFTVIVADNNKDIINFLKKKKIKHVSKNIKRFLEKIKYQEYDWLLNIWGPIIYKKEILKKFKNNLNLHPSFLPFARGKDPYYWSIYHEYPIGITIHEMDEKIDNGKIYLRKKYELKFPIKASEVFNLTLKKCRDEFIKNWSKIRNKKIRLKKLNFKNKLIHKRADLIKNNFLNLDNNKNIDLRKFVLNCLGQDFDFLKFQIKMNKKIYDCKLNLNVNVKKKW